MGEQARQQGQESEVHRHVASIQQPVSRRGQDMRARSWPRKGCPASHS
jgi:hypothetical protein